MAAAPRWVILFALLACAAIFLSGTGAAALEFRVGGPRGWHKPNGNDSETYNEWARRNRFHVGDTVYFKYVNDSVLVVDYDHYSRCNLTDPLQDLGGNNGGATVTFDRYGFFYFISGQPGHCSAGQKLVVRVMVHPQASGAASPAPSPAPDSAPAAGRGSSGPSSTTANSSAKLGVGVSAVAMAALALVAALAASPSPSLLL